MQIRDVQMPQRRQQNPLGTISSGLGIYSGVKGLIPTTGAPTVQPTPTGVETPTGASGVQTGSTGAASDYSWSAMGPIAIGAGSMAFGAKAQSDYNRKGDSAGNAPYASKSGSPAISAGQYGYSDAVAKRMESSRQLSPERIRQTQLQVEQLNIPRADKDSILGKLGEAFSLANVGKNIKSTFKMG